MDVKATMLWRTADQGNLEAVKNIIKEYRIDDVLRGEMLWQASIYGRLHIFKILVQLDVPGADYTERNTEALRLAAGRGHFEVVKFILTLDIPGIDYTKRNTEVLDWAVKWGYSSDTVSWGYVTVVHHLSTLLGIAPLKYHFAAGALNVTKDLLPGFKAERMKLKMPDLNETNTDSALEAETNNTNKKRR